MQIAKYSRRACVTNDEAGSFCLSSHELHAESSHYNPKTMSAFALINPKPEATGRDSVKQAQSVNLIIFLLKWWIIQQ